MAAVTITGPTLHTASVMTPEQMAARMAIERFVQHNDGDTDDIRTYPGAYAWTAPDGRVAQVGWVSA